MEITNFCFITGHVKHRLKDILAVVFLMLKTQHYILILHNGQGIKIK